MKEKCGNCRFFEPVKEVGECRRYPPNQDGKGSATVDEFPTVRKDLWCGEFKKGARK